VEEEQEEYEEEEEGGGGGGAGGGVRPPGKVMEQEKRIRREIANSNERRRMQSINAGFSSLRSLLPHHEGIRQDHTIV
jgi:transcription factor AP-4